MAPFGIGLIGAGRMGRTHLRALAGSDVVKVAAIAEMSPAAREAVAALIAILSEATKVGGLTDAVWVYGKRLVAGWVTC